MTDEPNQLGEYLRARRELVTPEQIGIPVVGSRRVPGLRREEVAMLAGISAEYYLRLEQGRDRNPSAQVLGAIGRVLQLDDDAYLLSLVADTPRRPRRRVRRETVRPSTLRLVAELPFPAFVEGRALDVLAANPLATALSPRLAVGRNRLRDVFLDEAERALFANIEGASAALVAGFRRAIGTDVDDPRVIELVGELSVASPEFRRVWARHDVGPRAGATLTFDHPEVGAIRLDREKLGVTDSPGAMLVVYHAEPGTESADKLAMLASASLTASAPHPRTPSAEHRDA
ncbi:helix-turn-helix domain-containing protein [Curtobacterium sp. Leaf261]|uniref:helix-turn-helix domain-containing protein n=1 Tax=Curtobacterium sp. Leaf261 TaxID=1736311 RepID=UPI0006F5EA6C|nr:helix-turn-helix transcriptional regulator [Curtobacterium sp. Leaf261]KQO60052.1 XRE family transcriptional regulator [Curtobacterium sp. Leaf261]